MMRLRVPFLLVVMSAILVLGSVPHAVGNSTGAPAATATPTPFPLTTQETAQPILLARVESMPLNTFDIHVITQHPFDAPWEVYSPDGTLRAAFSIPNMGHVAVTEQATGKTIFTVELGFVVMDGAFSFDNTLVVFTGMVPYYYSEPSPVVIYSLVTGEHWSLGDTVPGARTLSPRFSHDGTMLGLYSVSGDSCSRLSLHGVQLWNLVTRRPINLALPFRATAFAFSPDDTRIVLGSSLGFCLRGVPGLAVLDLASGVVVFQSDLDTIAVAFSPDGRYLLAFEGTSPTFHLWDSHTGILIGRFEIDPALQAHNFYARFDTNRVQIVIQTGEGYIYSGEIPLPET